MKYYSKTKTRKTLIVVGAILAVLLIVGLLFNMGKTEDEFTKVNTSWTVGGIDDRGNYDKEVTDTLVSDLILIGSVNKTVPEFTSGVQFYFCIYDENYNFLASLDGPFSTTHMSTYDELVEAGYSDAKYVRIVLDPSDEDGEINFFEKIKYANSISIYTKALDAEE